MSVGTDILDWARDFAQKEYHLYKASLVGTAEEYAHLRTEMFSRWLVDDGPPFRGYLLFLDDESREDIDAASSAAALTPREVSLVRQFRDPHGVTSYRVYLGRPSMWDATKCSWDNMLVVRQTPAGLRGLAFYAGCGRCRRTGNLEGYLCPYCQGDRWVQIHGKELSLDLLGTQVAVERLIPPAGPEQLAEYESDEGLAPVRGLPPYPHEIG